MSGRLLVAYSNASNFVATTAEYLESIARFSRFDVRYVHVTNDAELAFDLNEFDAVFQSYCVRLPVDNYVSADYLARIKAFRGVKLLAVQDEYERTGKLRSAMQDIGWHSVLTCVPPSSVPRIYPPQMFPGTEFITVLTGYVPEHLALRGKSARPLRDRQIVIGYRGRDIGGRYGRLAFDKFEIGRRMREICAARGIAHDIEWTDDKRLYGAAWYDFIGSCRANLGSESGSNVFDFDGAIEAKYRELKEARGGPVPYEAFRPYTDPIEPDYDMGQISPRVFEAAAMRTPMVLFTGRYSGLIKPDEHYIELKKDFSNVEAVLARLGDLDALEQMAQRAYDRLVTSDDFSYRRFVGLIDDTIERKAAELGMAWLPPPRDRPDPIEVGVDPAALASLREQPTRAPRHFVFFQYKYIALQNRILIDEITRLNTYYSVRSEELNAYYSAKIAEFDAYLAAKSVEFNTYYATKKKELDNHHSARSAEFDSFLSDKNMELEVYRAVASAEASAYMGRVVRRSRRAAQASRAMSGAARLVQILRGPDRWSRLAASFRFRFRRAVSSWRSHA